MELLLTYGFVLLLSPLLMFSFLFLWKDCTHWKKYLAMYILFWGIIAFYYAPQPGSGDLVRYYERIDVYYQYSLIGAIKKFPYREIGENSITWIASRLNMPGILPCIAASTVYGGSAYISCDYAEKKGRSDIIKWILLVQLLIIPFNSVVNNIFNVTAFSLVLLAIYRDLIKNKKNIITIFLYLIACFIHQSALILIITRFLAIPAKKLRYLAMAIIVMIPGLINLLYSNRVLVSNISIIYSLINRANYYLNEANETEFALRVQTDFWYRVFFVICMGFAILIIFAVLRILNNRSNKNGKLVKDEKTFLTFIFLSGLLTVSCIVFSMPHYWRFILIGQMAIGPVITLYDNDKFLFAWKNIFISFSILQTVIQLYRLLKSAVILKEWILGFLLSSPVIILIKIIIAPFIG